MPKKAQSDGYSSVRLPQELVKEVDEHIDRSRGLTSRADVVKEALRQFLTQLDSQKPKLPRFEHFNAGPNGVRITDRKIGMIADIYIKPQGIFCDLDKSDKCEHIDFALAVPKIQKIIRERQKEGWKLPDV